MTTKIIDHNFNEPDCEGSATVTLVDGMITQIDYYVWQMEEYQPFTALRKIYGDFTIEKETGGNGHYLAILKTQGVS